ncbi:cytochrome P450 [Hymenopellis radicata]|nr:cytochrome P450 [Hymenopellis radicata]
MSYPLFSDASSCALIVFALLLTVIIYRAPPSRREERAPGPKPYPIVGNALQIPSEHPEQTFQAWSDIYGDVLHLRVFSQPMIVLNSLSAAEELLEKRGAIYSDRPRFVLFSELMGWKNASTHVRYGARFRKHRRFIHQTFNQRAAKELAPVQYEEAATLIGGFSETPEAFVDHIRRYSAASILKITYGTEVKSVDDLYVRLAERAGTLTVQSGTPAASLVDYFPIIRHIPTWAPFSGFKRNAEEVKAAVELMMNVPYETVKEQMVLGTAKPSFTARLIEDHLEAGGLNADTEEDIKGVAGTLYAAAEDTTACVITSFMLAMVLYPEVQMKAQQELDRVLGPLKVPTCDDRDALPYIENVLKEVYRWNPPVPLGLPHRVMQDDVYCDHVIPEGSTILANVYAILKNCSDPDVFRPERFMEESVAFDPREVVFGFGRRKCPGKYFADHGFWMAMVMILAKFTICKKRDASGHVHEPEARFETGFVRHPKKFACDIIARQ